MLSSLLNTISPYTYLLVNLWIVLFPLIFSFESRVMFYKKWIQLFWSALPVSLFFIVWDFWATSRGHWAFNPAYTLDLKLGNLPLEEVLFFITVPYSTIFLYELTTYIFNKKQILNYVSTPLNTSKIHPSVREQRDQNSKKLELDSICILFLFLGMYFLGFLSKEYSGFVLLVTAASTQALARQKLLMSKIFWSWMVLCIFLFMMTNSVLTGLPVVTYDVQFNTGVRVGSIPIEDFFYNWSLLGLYVFSYKKVTNRV